MNKNRACRECYQRILGYKIFQKLISHKHSNITYIRYKVFNSYINQFDQMIDIQIVSDTHLEFRGDNFKNLIKPSAPILFLLGDISACGSPTSWETYKKYVCAAWEI